ncbi:TorF family putative porin [Variovorax robiniae]
MTALAAALSVPASAIAQTETPAAAPTAEPAPAPKLTGNVTLTTNYKFRGQDQDQIGRNDGTFKTSGFKPAIQGGFDYAFGDSGFYVGNWNSSVNWLKGNSIESDIYGGYKFKAGVLDLDVGMWSYLYPGNTAGNTVEFYGSVGYTSEVAGTFKAKYSGTVSDDYFNYAGNKAGSGLKGAGTGYLNLTYSKEVVTRLTLNAGVGYTFMSPDIRSLGYTNYLDYSVGLAYDLGSGLSVQGMVQGANHEGSYEVTGTDGKTLSPNKPRFIAAITKVL